MRTTFILCLALLLSVVTRAQELSYNFSRGFEAYLEDNMSEALYYFNKEVEENPDNAYANYYIAECLHKENQEAGKVLSFVKKAIKLAPSDCFFLHDAYTLRGATYHVLGDTARAVEDLTMAISLDPDNDAPYYVRGIVYYQEGRFDLAAKDFMQVTKVSGDFPGGHFMLARSYLDLERWTEAIEQVDYALNLDPQYSDSFYTLRAKAHIALKDYDKAIDDVISSLVKRKTNEAMDLICGPLAKNAYAQTEAKLKAHIDQENNSVRMALVAFYCYNYKYEEALTYSKEAFAINADDAFCCAVLCNVYRNLGDYDNALYYCNRAIDLNPTDFSYLIGKAEIFIAQGKYHDAIATYDAYVSHDPVNGEAYYTRGLYKMTCGDLDGAVEDFTMAITLNPDEARFYLRRGQANAKKGNSQLAKADYKKAIEMDSTSKSLWISYAFLGLGQKDKAFEVVNAINAENPDSSDGYFLMSRFYAQAGEYDKSLEFMDKCLAKGYSVSWYVEFIDFVPMRELPQFKELIKKYTKKYPVGKLD